MDIPVTLNVKSANNIPIISCMQGDTPTIVCSIMNGTDAFNVDSGEFDMCVCEGETAKHKAISIGCTVNGNIVTVHLTKNETDEAGDLKLCISFSNTAQELVVSTFPFILKATENPAYSAVGQKENIKALTDYVAEAKKYADAAKESGANISEYVDNAKKYAESALESVTNAENAEKMSQSYAIGGSGIRDGEDTNNSKYYSEKSAESKASADKAAEMAKQSANKALESAESVSEIVMDAENAEKMSQSYAIGGSGIRDGEDTNNSKYYSEIAAESASEAKQSEDIVVQNATNALESKEEAKKQAQIATTKADEASTSATNASNSENNALEYSNVSKTNADNSAISESNALVSATKAKESENTSIEMAKTSRSYAVGDTDFRENEATDNAMYYYQQAKQISAGLAGALLPMGTVTYEELSSQTKESGYMYNISNDFTSDSTFKDGGNIKYSAGTNVYYTADGFWDCLAGDMGNFAFKTDVPKLVKVDGTTITKDADGTLHGVAEVTIDSALSDSSTNPVQNKVIKSALDGKADNNHTHNNYLTAHPTITKSSDTTSTVSPSAGGTFTAVDSVTRDSNGHVTRVNTKTVTLPNEVDLTNVENEITNLKKSVSDGKTTVANAITEKGVETATDATFAVMAENIEKISGGSTVAINGEIWQGKALNLNSYSILPVNIDTSTLPYNFNYGQVVIFNNEIHILGGGNNSTEYTKHYKFDGSDWVEVSTLPYELNAGSAVVYNNEIHIMGRYAIGAKPHYKYDGSNWTKVSTLPYDFMCSSAVIFNNEIHILGGGNSSTEYTKHYKFDGSDWVEVSTLPYNFYQGSAVVYNNEIHILGSSTGGNYTKHYKFDGSTWTLVSTLPYNFYQGSAVVYNDEIHIMGTGDSNGSYCIKHYKFDGSTWTLVSTLPYNFYRGSAVVYNDEIHIMGSGVSNYYTNHYVVYITLYRRN